MSKPMTIHPLVDVDVEYVDIFKCKREQTTIPISVERPDSCMPERIPVALDIQINRYHAAVAISDAIDLAKKASYVEAQSKINTLISKVEHSPSAAEKYCVELANDLKQCLQSVSNTNSFAAGIHTAHAFCSMHFMEKFRSESKYKELERIGCSYKVLDDHAPSSPLTHQPHGCDTKKTYKNAAYSPYTSVYGSEICF